LPYPIESKLFQLSAPNFFEFFLISFIVIWFGKNYNTQCSPYYDIIKLKITQ